MNKLLSLTVLLMLGSFGCDKPSPPATEAPKARSLGITADCVICVDHPIDVTDRTAHADHLGRTYYFCSDGCLDDFTKDPAAAIAKFDRMKAPASQPATAPAQVP